MSRTAPAATEILTLEVVAEFAANMATAYKRKRKSPRTIEYYASDMRQFIAWCDAQQVRPTAAELEGLVIDWLIASEDNKAARTVRRRHASASVFASWWGVGGRDFLDDYAAPPIPKPTPKVLENGQDDSERLIRHAIMRGEDQLALAYALQNYMALRVAEAVSVRACDYLPAERVLRVFGKGGKFRDIPVPNRMLNMLEARVADLGGCEAKGQLVEVAESTARAKMRSLAAEIGIDYSSHMGRATCATTLYDRTKDPVMAKDLLGHANLETTMNYLAVGRNDMRDALEGVGQ